MRKWHAKLRAKTTSIPPDGPAVDIRVGSIHSAKGETHTATLVLDTFFYDHHLRALRPWLLGQRLGQGTEGPRMCSRLKQHYVDLGNPLHRYVFIEAMFKDAFLRGGRVYIRGGVPGTGDPSFIGADTFSSAGVGIVPYVQFDNVAPPLVLPGALSARGLVSEMRMERRMALDVHQKVMRDLSFSRSLRDLDREFSWDLSQLPDAPEEVNVQASKIADYLLNHDHQDIQGKAKFFAEHLGLTKSDRTYLHGQFIDALGHVTYDDVRIDDYGVRFTANLPVTGKNGKTATIETGWIVRPGERASFVTAYPGEKDAALEVWACRRRLVSGCLFGGVRWRALCG